MTSIEPQVKPDALYQLGEAAALLGVSQSTLHRYTEAGLIKARIRKTNGRRVWKGSDLLTCWRVIY